MTSVSEVEAWLSTSQLRKRTRNLNRAHASPSHLQIARHLPAKFASTVAKLHYPHLSSSNMDFSDILYVLATLELGQA